MTKSVWPDTEGGGTETMTRGPRHLVVTDRTELRRLIADGHMVSSVRRARNGVIFLVTKTPVLKRLRDRLNRAGVSWSMKKARRREESDE